ncbi:MAG: AAA family ATPase [Anaerolineae bacterium]|nr:AAA family ATPase [Anaerolineae bacterium]
MKCPNCDFENLPDARYCGSCGTRVVQVCISCGRANPLNYRYCVQCGTLLYSPREADFSGTLHLLPEISSPAQLERAAGTSAARVTENISSLTHLERVPDNSNESSSFPQSIAEVLPIGSETKVSPATIQLQGERRVATIILADVKGSTDLLEFLGTESWVEIMNRLFYILEAEIYRFGGEVDQFRGDGLVAFFGTSVAHEDDPERAVMAAMAMQQAIQPYAAELQHEGIDLRLRVGVNTGQVIVTHVGDRQCYSEDTAMGEAIALAARMESAAEPGTVLVSENTYPLVQSQFEWLPLGEIRVKGVSHPIAVYRPLSLSTESTSLPPYGLSNPLREVEYQVLQACVEDLYDGLGGIVMLMGEKGMGKSLLVSRIRHYFNRQEALLAEARTHELPGVWAEVGLQLRGRCRSYAQSHPYAMWIDLLHDWLGVREDEFKEVILDILYHKVQALWGDDLEQYYPYLAVFLGLPLEDPFLVTVEHLDAEKMRQQIFRVIGDWIETLTWNGPLLLTFTDMHWADASSLELLRYCLPFCDREMILWIFMFRPERDAPIWKFRYDVETEYPHRLTTLELAPLTPEQSDEFFTRLFGGAVLPEQVRDFIIEKAEGNPYYIQELSTSLMTQGILIQHPQSGLWQVTRDLDSLDVPDSLQSLLLARIDRLSADEQRILQIASVIGSAFWSNILRVLAGGTPSLEKKPLKMHLTALQRAELIRERGRIPDLGMEYIFKSTLIRDAVYDSLLSGQRADYHLKLAEYLENWTDREAVTQYYGALAYHYRCAKRLGKDLFYTLQAAAQAQKIYANTEALEYYSHALAVIDELLSQNLDEKQRYQLWTQQFFALNGRREVYRLLGNFDAQWEDARALLPLARKLEDDPAWLIDALLEQPGVLNAYNRGEVATGLPLVQEALSLAQQIGDKHREMQSMIALVNLYLTNGDAEWEQMADRALELTREIGDLQYEARLLISMGRVFAFSDQFARSTACLEAVTSLSFSPIPEEKLLRISLLDLQGLQLERSGDYHRLLTEYQQERLYLSREIGHRPLEANALARCGEIEALYLGDYDHGLMQLEAARRIWEGTADEPDALLRIVQIQLQQGQFDEAQKILEYLQHLDESVPDFGRARLRLITAMLYNAWAEPAYLQQVFDVTAEAKILVQANSLRLVASQLEMVAACQAAIAHLKLARFCSETSEQMQHRYGALQEAQVALDIYQRYGFVQVIESVSEEILFRYGQALAANQRSSEADIYLHRAYEELLRKAAFIPLDCAFYHTYMENILLHCEIQAAYAVGMMGYENCAI